MPNCSTGRCGWRPAAEPSHPGRAALFPFGAQHPVADQVVAASVPVEELAVDPFANEAGPLVEGDCTGVVLEDTEGDAVEVQFVEAESQQEIERFGPVPFAPVGPHDTHAEFATPWVHRTCSRLMRPT